jgi:hypothetical protein
LPDEVDALRAEVARLRAIEARITDGAGGRAMSALLWLGGGIIVGVVGVWLVIVLPSRTWP